MRCFVAVDLPDEVRKELAKLQKELPESRSKIVEQENLHLTFIFLGELTDFQVNQCRDALKKISFKGFKASTGKLGVFPSENFIRVAWISLEPALLLKGLHDKIFESIKNAGIKADSRFESHITLARIKHIKDKTGFIKKLKAINPRQAEFEVKSFALKKSTLTRNGPVYETITEFSLC